MNTEEEEITSVKIALKYVPDPPTSNGLVGFSVVVLEVIALSLAAYYIEPPVYTAGTALGLVVGCTAFILIPPLMVERWRQKKHDHERHRRFNQWHEDGQWKELQNLPANPVEDDWVRLSNWDGFRVFANYYNRSWTITFDHPIAEQETQSSWFVFFWWS